MEKRKKITRCFYAPPLSKVRASDAVGKAGIAPFLVVVMAPHAHENLSTSFNLASSCIFFSTQISILYDTLSLKLVLRKGNYFTSRMV